jgi:CTP:molybdopterin cytidylyltransferase MocA
MRPAAAILAAGSSSRLGRPKQLVDVEGEPLLRRTARLVLEADFGPVVVVLGASYDLIAPSLDGLPVGSLVNKNWGEGMASSLRAGAAWATNTDADGCLFLPCDLLLLNLAHLQNVRRAWEKGATLVASTWDETVGAPAIFARGFWPELLALRGDVGARSIFRAHASEVVTVPFADGGCDLDMPEDLKRVAFINADSEMP